MLLNQVKICSVILYVFLFLINNYSHATVLVLPVAGNIVGKVKYAQSEVGESIDEVGRRFDIGYYEMVRANLQVDPIHLLAAGTRLIIPSQFILPDVPRKGIIINLAEYRLYYFPEDENVVITFPVGIGREGWNTPLGRTKITSKVINPAWRPTKKLLAAAEEIGAPIPDFFPPGPNNPLGKHVLRLGWPTFLIHGTNRSDGIGARASAGCIRMLPDDIEYLYSLVTVGTPVRIINEPVKIGRENEDIYIQMYPLLKEQKNDKLQTIMTRKLGAANVKNWVTSKIIQNELKYPSGLVKQINN
ncbi:L,D-transpeptidase family protein [Legionella fallonii]|uniref:Putative ErfK/YbiS/YcfS/YnhG family protein n=1 Tax=Legionella fallonii LLAP-10 TaxID=1212491 RepID=A0A098G3K7_9GAMM|nr:L,D-transpeptidase family protein [Legionella fallonii]CEG57057.1 putative ErfK/YbiS/YcfS/YnhG family protein precursor [Legionella fallonii LLAP-10]